MINKILVFKNSGWCEKLGKSYEKGRYQPKTDAEFKALEKFAAEVVEIKAEVVPTAIKAESDPVTKSTVEDNKPEPTEPIDAPEITETVEPSEPEEEFTDEQIAELRKKGKRAKIKNWHTMKPEPLRSELGLDEQ